MQSEVLKGIGRALAGALLFATPILLTMEIWRLSLSVERYRLVILLVVTVLLVVCLARELGGAADPTGWRSAAVDGGVAFLAAAFAAALVLTAVAAVRWRGDWRDALSIVAVQTVPAAIGASYARSQLGQSSADPGRKGYGHELFLMVAGAVVFAANVAPTEEIVLLAARATPWHALALVVLGLALMHGIVYHVGFKGQETPQVGRLRVFLTLTVVGYGLALCVSVYLLWTFGRFDDAGLGMSVTEVVILTLPASLGAAAARLIL